MNDYECLFIENNRAICYNTCTGGHNEVLDYQKMYYFDSFLFTLFF